ncbi:hypothetical protein DPMN_186275 [Dreissena polymorpha]|uniref:Uncharacterized protein n=1 Tax=Dreissena polymorpha TaxID=45954 RepID=A0A9D4I6E0_DREPO|nr:hypothetical protein DPMN_186275 [Dreissena polymorpha]
MCMSTLKGCCISSLSHLNHSCLKSRAETKSSKSKIKGLNDPLQSLDRYDLTRVSISSLKRGCICAVVTHVNKLDG